MMETDNSILKASWFNKALMGYEPFKNFKLMLTSLLRSPIKKKKSMGMKKIMEAMKKLAVKYKKQSKANS